MRAAANLGDGEDEQPVDAASRELEDATGYRAGQVEHLITFQPMVETVDAEHTVTGSASWCYVTGYGHAYTGA